MCGCKEEDFWKLVTFGQFLHRPQGPRGARDLKFTIYVPLVLKMLHTKCDKNWTGGYQEEVKNVQLLTDIMYQIWPRPGARTPTPGITKFTILVEAFLLYITMHLVSLRHVRLSRRRFLKIGHFWAVFAPPPGGQETWNLQFKCPLSQRCFILNLKRIRLVVIKKKLKMFNC